MSLILDALRKSEAARRRSETPDLFSPTPQASAPARPRPAWPLWTLAGIAVASSAIAAWVLLHRPAPDAPAARPAQHVVADAPTSTPAAAPAPSTPRTLPVIPTAPPPAAASTTTAAAPPVARPPAPVQAASPALPPETTPAPSPAPAPSPQAPAPKPLPAPPAGDRPTALADLDAGVRSQLPPLKLSMHLWNEDAQRRFVILDGQHLREGDTLGELVVERIDRDDVVLSWRGARLRLPAE